MATVSVNVRRRGESDEFAGPVLDLRADVERARMLATLLDSQFEVAGIRFGMDALIGVIPVVGDAISSLAGTYPLFVARKHKLGRILEMKMVANLALDFAGGLIPVVGDIFDVAFKANLKNLALLERAAEKHLSKT